MCKARWLRVDSDEELTGGKEVEARLKLEVAQKELEEEGGCQKVIILE